MKKHIEKTYGTALKGVFYAVNPLKKRFLKTYCTVHKFINIQALEMVKNEGFNEEYDFFKKYIKNFNDGVTWADQDFKSSNHFYHYNKGRGLYGFSNALKECKKYYKKALTYIELGNIEKAIFYLGAACHLVQDTTVPQHVNNKLLKSHRRFELWIISKLLNDYTFIVDKGIVRYDTLDEYIKNNANLANSTYLKFINVEKKEEKYKNIATIIIHRAEKTTAGVMLDFYNDIRNYIENL